MPRLTTANRREIEVREASVIPVGSDRDESQFRSTAQGTRQDLPPFDQEMQARISRFNYTKNLIGHRLLELMRDYVIGGDVGVRILARNQQVQEVLDEHWNDPFNDWPRRLPQDVLDMSQDGELLVPVQVGEGGHVIAGKIDPTIIKKVVPEPFYAGRVKSLVVKGPVGRKDTELKIIALDRDKKSSTFRRRVGDAFFWGINKPSSASRGISDLFALQDFIDQLDRFIYARARNAELRNLFVWDVTLKGATEPQVKHFLDDLQLNPPTSGSTRAHNDQVAWSSVRPQIEAADASREMEMMMSYILFGFGIPPTATGIVSTGRTALSEQIDMLYKTFSSRAREVRNIVVDLLSFVIDQAIIGGRLAADVDTGFRVVLPRIALRDIQRTGGALARVGEFFSNMEKLGIYDKPAIKQMMDIFLAALGFDVPDAQRVEQKDSGDEDVAPGGDGKEPQVLPRRPVGFRGRR